MYKLILLLFALVVSSFQGMAQPLSMPLQPHALSDTTKIKVQLNGSSYFYNYEYFKPFAKGYTQPGFSLIPTVEANFGDRLVLGGGVHLKKYWGTKPFGEVAPVVYARYELLQNFYVQVGTVMNRDGHMLSDILYNPLYEVDFRQENGLQLRYYGKRIFADAWVSWDHYLKEGADDQEMLTAGASFAARLTSPESQWELLLPVQAVFMHLGGQINDKVDTAKRVRTLSNLSAGIQLAYRYAKNSRVGILLQPIKFNDSYSFKPTEGNKGQLGLSSVLFLKAADWNLQLGYLYGKRFYSILGDQIYNNLTFYYDYVDKARSLFSATATYRKEVYRGITFRFDAGGYYDPSYVDIDYYYGAGVVFDFTVLSRTVGAKKQR